MYLEFSLILSCLLLLTIHVYEVRQQCLHLASDKLRKVFISPGSLPVDTDFTGKCII